MTQKTILITGATAGIGKATAEALAGDGHRLILTGRREGLLREVAAGLPVETLPLAFDVRDRGSVLAALEQLPEAWRTVDVLVNNAGLALGLETFEANDFAHFETMMQTNLSGLLAMTHAVLPGMKARGRGHIVNLSSIAGTFHYAGGHVYGATKAFVTYLSQALRADMVGSPVRVTNIEPGMVDTEFSMVRFQGDKSRADAVYAGVEPLHAADIAETIRWAIAQPPHVNINRIEVMPVCQAPAGLAVHRG